MEILTSSKNVIVSNFPDFETRFTYQPSEHVETICDFQFFGLRKFFVLVNRKAGIEILRTLDDDAEKISRLKKVQIKNINAASSPNSQNCDELAIGLLDGRIKFLNYKSFESTNYFPADSSGAGVVSLDYSACDDYLSAVYENGTIAIYGMKSRKKMETLKFDKTCTLSKFHPFKRFCLGVTTYKGSVYLYDTNTKQEIYKHPKAHESPCRDIAMCASYPNRLLSVGFDRIINFMDTRSGKSSFKIDCNCPLSTVSMSECGNYFCVGNLKGEVQSYDVRNPQDILYSKHIHDAAIFRLAFVPNQKINETVRKSITSNFGHTTKQQRPSDLNYNQEQSQQLFEETKTVVNENCSTSKGKRDSFFELIDICSNNKKTRISDVNYGYAKIEPTLQKQSNSNTDNKEQKRYSFLDFLDECTSKTQNNIESKDSNDTSLNRRVSALILQPRQTEPIPETEETDDESVVFISSEVRDGSLKGNQKQQQQVVINKTPITISCENSLNKETTPNNNNDLEGTENFMDIERNVEVSTDNDEKDEKQRALRDISNVFGKDIIEEFPKLPDDKNSTPNNLRNKLTLKNEIKANSSNSTPIWCEIKEEIQNLRKEVANKFTELENEIKFNAETNKWQILNQNAHLFSKQTTVNEQVQEALFYLLKTDEFLNDYLKLKRENAELKSKLSQISERRRSK